MSVINANPLMLGDAGYNIQRSLRFRSSASAYLSRTLSASGNGTTWTWAGWVKRGKLGAAQKILGTSYTSTSEFYLQFNAADQIDYGSYTAGGASNNFALTSTQVFRDPSAWYFVQFVWDTTQATAANRVKIYVNGSQITSFGTATYPTQNYSGIWNNSLWTHCVGADPTGRYFDGYLAEVNFIDGQALTPSSFGQTDAVTGVWTPKKYTGTYGTNGFYLPFSDNTSATTLAYDKSGNGNNWTPNNISTTAGATYDSMTDVPTLTSATAANFAVLNPLYKKLTTISNGNLQVDGATGSGQIAFASMAIPASGKFYWEVTASNAFQSSIGVGCILDYNSGFLGTGTSSAQYYYAGNTTVNGVSTTTLSSFTNGDVIGVAIDASTGRIWFAKNGTWQNSGDPAAGTGYLGAVSNTYDYFPVSNSAGTGTFSHICNFGQRPFSYTPPTGFKALNTFNLPDPTIKKPNQYMDATTWTGDNTSPRAITNAGSFQPDLVWVKGRNGTINHVLVDAVRGTSKNLISNSTSAEVTTPPNGSVSAFNSNGFSVSTGTSDSVEVNYSVGGTTYTYVGWQWKKGATPGFDIVTYTGNGSTQNISHSLGVAPKMIIIKNRAAAENWAVGFADRGWSTAGNLNLTNAWGASTYFNSTAPTSSVFSVGNSANTNSNGVAYVAYLFAEILGFSKFGSYTGNGSTDGPFVYCGFRPKYVMVKRSDAIENWYVHDAARDTYNQVNTVLYPNLSNAEGASNANMDFTSNGFKIRESGGASNASGGTYIFAAFAENPFKNSLAR